MNILLLGKNGQVGWELQRALAPLGKVTALDRRSRGGLSGDLSNPDALVDAVRTLKPEAIVNAAAYTAVDKAESEPDLAYKINAEAPSLLAREAAGSGALLVHYSTDYVFNGEGKTPWRETDSTGPLNVYGQSKLAGEEGIKHSGCRYLVFRTSWVYAARGRNFIRTMLRLAGERESLQVVNDQVGAPTGAELIADVTAHAIVRARQSKDMAGTFHLAAAGETSWQDYARFVLEHAQEAGWPLRARAGDVGGIPTDAYPAPAARPRNSRLDCTRLVQAFGLQLPDWRLGVGRVIDELEIPETTKV